MRLRLPICLRRVASGLMLLGVLASVLQSAMINASQAAAAAGSIPEPAVVLSGAIHFHGTLVRHVYMHGGDNGPGHVHGAADHDHDHDDADGAVKTPLWTLGGSSAVIATIGASTISSEVVGSLTAPPQGRPDGVRPDGLLRPPSTPSIA